MVSTTTAAFRTHERIDWRRPRSRATLGIAMSLGASSPRTLSPATSDFGSHKTRRSSGRRSKRRPATSSPSTRPRRLLTVAIVAEAPTTAGAHLSRRSGAPLVKRIANTTTGWARDRAIYRAKTKRPPLNCARLGNRQNALKRPSRQ